MKRHMTKIASIAALAAGMAFAQAPAAPPQRPGFGIRGAIRQRVLRNLNLTDSQKAQAKTIFQQARQAAQPVRQQIQQNRDALNAAVKNNDAAQIQQLAATAGNLQGQALAIRSGAMAQFYTLLTPDQKAKFDQMRQRARQMMRQRTGQGNNG
jgi:periplasmic protein CpxP/Spy